MSYRALTVAQWLNEAGRPEEPRISDEFLTGWIVLQGDVPRFNARMTEVEARIIAFAMQAIEDDLTLAAFEPDDFDQIPAYIDSRTYSGPTDGVAHDKSVSSR